MGDAEVIERIRGLAIPPAWKDVWICADPLGHLQATGIDDAGRKQYLYHPRWRERRDREKFRRMERFAELLPPLRRQIKTDIEADTKLASHEIPSRTAVLACAVRLLDVGLFRIGSEQYGDEDHGVGLATVRREHVAVRSDEEIEFDYPAKGGVRRVQVIKDPICGELVQTLRRRRAGPPELLAYRQSRRWRQVRSSEINDYLKHHLGDEFSAKDFRTWNATVLASVSLASEGGIGASKSARKRAMDRAVAGVAELLHRPTGVRPLLVRLDDRGGPETGRRPATRRRSRACAARSGGARPARGGDRLALAIAHRGLKPARPGPRRGSRKLPTLPRQPC